MNFITSRPVVANLVLVLCGLAMALGMTLLFGPPLPEVHDEFSYLLMGDTFAHGRLANPVHPLARFMETFHVLVQPAYASKYFPLQGMVLALGLLLGHPVIGNWILCAFMGPVFNYAARSMLPPSLAWLTAVVFTVQFTALNIWHYVYWGGLPFCLSGILVLGGVFHQWKKPSFAHGIATGLGLAGIILSRPLEGFFFLLPLGCLTLWQLIGKANKGEIIQLSLPPAICAFAALAFLGLYNHSVTGDILKFPHTEYHEQYFPDMKRLAWDERGGEAPERDIRFEEYARAVRDFRPADPGEWLIKMGKDTASWAEFYLPWFVLFGMAFLLLKPIRIPPAYVIALLAILLLRFLIPFLSASVRHEHYTAAWAAMSLGFFAAGLANFASVAGARRLVLLFTAIFSIQGFQVAASLLSEQELVSGSSLESENPSFGKSRRHLEDRLASHPGVLSVAIVQYQEGQDYNFEWVYNGADVDNQRVVWLYDNGDGTVLPAAIDYYPDRLIWLVKTPGRGFVYELELLRNPFRKNDETAKQD